MCTFRGTDSNFLYSEVWLKYSNSYLLLHMTFSSDSHHYLWYKKMSQFMAEFGLFSYPPLPPRNPHPQPSTFDPRLTTPTTYKPSTLDPQLVQWILTKACFAVWTMFYDWFWYYGVSRAEISRVPLWHPWAEFFKGKNKMAARYFKVQYVFFQQIKPGTSVIPHFHVILTGQSISCIIFMI